MQLSLRVGVYISVCVCVRVTERVAVQAKTLEWRIQGNICAKTELGTPRQSIKVREKKTTLPLTCRSERGASLM